MAGERTPAAVTSLLLALLLPACAARQPSSPFIIRSGHGPIDAGHLPTPSKSQRQDMEHARREALAKRAAERPATLPSIERLDRGLRESSPRWGGKTGTGPHSGGEELLAVASTTPRLTNIRTLWPSTPSVVAWDSRASGGTGAGELALSDVHRAIFTGPMKRRPEHLGTILRSGRAMQRARGPYADALTRNLTRHGRGKISAGWLRQRQGNQAAMLAAKRT